MKTGSFSKQEKLKILNDNRAYGSEVNNYRKEGTKDLIKSRNQRTSKYIKIHKRAQGYQGHIKVQKSDNFEEYKIHKRA